MSQQPKPLQTTFAVFEILPASTPIKWANAKAVFVENMGKKDTHGSTIAGVVLPDQSIAVLRTRYGAALGHCADEDAANLTGGRVLRIESETWPTADECFAAIVEDCEQGTPADDPAPSSN